jgi:hypothetical protein
VGESESRRSAAEADQRGNLSGSKARATEADSAVGTLADAFDKCDSSNSHPLQHWRRSNTSFSAFQIHVDEMPFTRAITYKLIGAGASIPQQHFFSLL